MGLSGDQKALLRLLAQREQGYEDIAALMGLSVEEVRVRVKDALDAVEREGGEAPPAPVEPRAETPTKKPEPAEERAPEPKAKPASPDTPPRAATAAKKPKPQRPALPKERRVLAIAAGLGAIIVVIVLLATGVLGGGDSDSSSNADAGSADTSQKTSAALNSTEEALDNSKLSGAVLKPVDGAEGEGAALFGQAKKEVLLQVEATGLEPTPQGSSYTIWFYKSPKLALRVGAVAAPRGGIRVRLPIPLELLNTIAGGVFDQVSVSLTSDAEYRAEVAKAKRNDSLPPYAGEEVLRGPIQGPITEADKGKAGN